MYVLSTLVTSSESRLVHWFTVKVASDLFGRTVRGLYCLENRRTFNSLLLWQALERWVDSQGYWTSERSAEEWNDTEVEAALQSLYDQFELPSFQQWLSNKFSPSQQQLLSSQRVTQEKAYYEQYICPFKIELHDIIFVGTKGQTISSPLHCRYHCPWWSCERVCAVPEYSPASVHSLAWRLCDRLIELGCVGKQLSEEQLEKVEIEELEEEEAIISEHYQLLELQRQEASSSESLDWQQELLDTHLKQLERYQKRRERFKRKRGHYGFPVWDNYYESSEWDSDDEQQR